MKLPSVILLGTFLLLSCAKQTPATNIITPKVVTQYCDLYCFLYGTGIVQPWVNTGNDIIQVGGKSLSMIAVLDSMSREGWEFVQAYSTPEQSENTLFNKTVLHYLLRRSITDTTKVETDVNTTIHLH